jgi:hypothetical protein
MAENKTPVDDADDPAGLTPAERQELKDRPLTTAFRDYTEDQLVLRISAAQKISRLLLANDSSLTPEMRAVYEALPTWAFWEYPDTNIPKRCYGVLTYDDGTIGAHCVTCMLGWTNDTVGGTPASSIRQVARWSDEQKLRIQANNAPGVFCDPLGWLLLLRG